MKAPWWWPFKAPRRGPAGPPAPPGPSGPPERPVLDAASIRRVVRDLTAEQAHVVACEAVAYLMESTGAVGGAEWIVDARLAAGGRVTILMAFAAAARGRELAAVLGVLGWPVAGGQEVAHG